MKRMRNLVIVFVGMFFIALALPGGTSAQQDKVIELTYGSPYGPGHTISRGDIKWFAKIEKETNGKVKIKPFYGGSLITGGGDAIDEMIEGVADIGFISPGQAKSGYDIAKASFLFFSGAKLEDGFRIFMEVLKKFPEIEKEYKGIKVMAWSSGVEYELISRKPVRKLGDLRGMRIKTLGEIVSVLKDLGVEGMASPMPEVYLNLQKGILDGAFATWGTLMSMRFAEVAKYLTALNLYRPHAGMRVMSLKSWNKLSPDIQKVFQNNIEWYSLETDKEMDKDEQAGKEFGKKNGVEYIDLPKEDMAKFYSLIQQEAVKAAQKLDAKGISGTKILEEAQRLIKSSGK